MVPRSGHIECLVYAPKENIDYLNTVFMTRGILNCNKPPVEFCQSIQTVLLSAFEALGTKTCGLATLSQREDFFKPVKCVLAIF